MISECGAIAPLWVSLPPPKKLLLKTLSPSWERADVNEVNAG